MRWSESGGEGEWSVGSVEEEDHVGDSDTGEWKWETDEGGCIVTENV